MQPAKLAKPMVPPGTRAPNDRIVSMDQFRGYTVAGMFVVNFLGGMAAIHPVLQHHNTYFSYADTIMPSFILAAGFSYRLSILRRLKHASSGEVYRSFVLRSILLVLVSVCMYGFGAKFSNFSELESANKWDLVAGFLKADLWEVLAIIGICQLFIMPVVNTHASVRVLVTVGLLVLHAALTHWFNYAFVMGRPNVLSNVWGVEGQRCFDGGPFGILTWSVPMLIGTLVYDLMERRSAGGAFVRLLFWGIALMAIGYGLSCLTRLYDVAPGENIAETSTKGHAVSPVWPDWDRLKDRSLESLLAEPPFMPPPPNDVRLENYWQMGKRVVTSSFVLFASGFALFAYGFFVLACDVGPLRIGVFRTFGLNPLIAYVIHHGVEEAVKPLVPKDSPLWWALTGFAIFFVLTYTFVRFLERRGLYIRL